MSASPHIRPPCERRLARRVNAYLHFEYLYTGRGGATFEGSGVTINVSDHGALLLMPRTGLEPGMRIDLFFNVRGDITCAPPLQIHLPAGQDGSFEGARGGEDYLLGDGEKAIRVSAMVVRIQRLTGLYSSSPLRFGIAVAFTNRASGAKTGNVSREPCPQSASSLVGPPPP